MPRKLSCKKCKKRDACVKLCNKVRKYVNQDVVGSLNAYMPIRATWMKHSVPPHYGGGSVPFSWNDLMRRDEGRFAYPFLSEIERKCLQLYHDEACSYNEIAQRVSKRASTVRGILARARKKVRQYERRHKSKNLP